MQPMERDRLRLVGAVRRAIEDYAMIEAGDRVAVGLSGGKDSLALLYALSRLRGFPDLPFPFELVALTVDLGFPGTDFSGLEAFCASLGVPFVLERTRIGPIVFDTRKEPNPCALCAKMRRGTLHQAARRLGCRRLALGHTMDDAVETLLLSMFYEGRVHCFEPVSWLSRAHLFQVRPLVLVKEDAIRALAADVGLPVLASPCPAAGTTSRHRVDAMLQAFEADDPHVGERVFAALRRLGIDGWKRPDAERRVPGPS